MNQKQKSSEFRQLPPKSGQQAHVLYSLQESNLGQQVHNPRNYAAQIKTSENDHRNCLNQKDISVTSQTTSHLDLHLLQSSNGVVAFGHRHESVGSLDPVIEVDQNQNRAILPQNFT